MTVARSPGEHADVVRAREMADLLRRGGSGWLLFAKEMPDIFDAALAALVAVAEDATRRAGDLEERYETSHRRSMAFAAERDRLEAERDRLRERVAEMTETLRQIADLGSPRTSRDNGDLARAALSGGTAEGSGTKGTA